MDQEVLCKARETTKDFANLWRNQNFACCFSLLVKALNTGNKNDERIKRYAGNLKELDACSFKRKGLKRCTTTL